MHFCKLFINLSSSESEIFDSSDDGGAAKEAGQTGFRWFPSVYRLEFRDSIVYSTPAFLNCTPARGIMDSHMMCDDDQGPGEGTTGDGPRRSSRTTAGEAAQRIRFDICFGVPCLDVRTASLFFGGTGAFKCFFECVHRIFQWTRVLVHGECFLNAPGGT